MKKALDIFDVIQPDKEDTFDRVESEDITLESVRNEFSKMLEKFDAKERKAEKVQFSDEMKEFIKAELAKIKPVQNVIEKKIVETVIEPKAVHLEPKIIEAPPQIIKEVRVEVEKKDTRKYVEESKYLDLLVKVSKLEKQLEDTRRMAEAPIFLGPGGPGVIGIPPPEPSSVGYVLTINDKKKAEWKAATGGTGGGTSSDAYAPTNVTTDRSFDADDVTLDELADVVGSLIASLQGAGVIQ